MRSSSAAAFDIPRNRLVPDNLMEASDNARAAQQKSTLLRLALFEPPSFLYRESLFGSMVGRSAGCLLLTSRRIGYLMIDRTVSGS
mmetsp:Transcript_19389/g.32760  ORF Transcript_19389/g.32760 Transcript_19389/m.32760 type:complete len:86 (+) Transcript_19389:743-1000(+)